MVLVFSFLFSGVVFADGGLKIATSPVVPNNQVKGVSSYFNLNVGDRKEQTLKVDVLNTSDKDITVYVKPVNALTSETGGIQYISEVKRNKSFLDEKAVVNNLITVKESKVVIPAGKVRQIEAHVKMPSSREGVYLGGLLFHTDYEEKDISVKEKEGVAFGIGVRYDIVVPIQLNFTSIDPVIEVGSPYLENLPSYIQIRLPLKNELMSLVKDFILTYEILDSNEKVLFSGKSNKFNIAPATEFHYPLRWGTSKLETGEYTIRGLLIFNGKEVPYSQKFVVDGKSVNQIRDGNYGDVQVESGFSWGFVLIVALLSGVLLLLFIILLLLLKRKKKEEKRESDTENLYE